MSPTGWECSLWNDQRVSEIFGKDFHGPGFCQYCKSTLYLRSHFDLFLDYYHFPKIDGKFKWEQFLI